ncbi:MAG TPA: hypothetical protein VK717_07600 [Opitutaceae bacterium]|jgi:hypothetical protein|nr:hypothetical protein [Opitutaceae bacterium]
MNQTQEIELLQREIVLLDEQMHWVELHRDYPPPGCRMRQTWVDAEKEKLRQLGLQRAQKVERLNFLLGQREFDFAKQFQAALAETACDGGARAEINSAK